jgi:hypothetical protein
VVDCTTYCYAVRCRGGFVLPTRINGKPEKMTQEYLSVEHKMSLYCEQEISMVGAIPWDDVVGIRVIRCNKDGQFFSGPIFLEDALRQNDHSQMKPVRGSSLSDPAAGRDIRGGDLLTISPKTATIAPGGSEQFTAASQGTNTGVVWSVDRIVGGNDTVGTISKDGLYKAPLTMHWHTVTATAVVTPISGEPKSCTALAELNVTTQSAGPKPMKRYTKPETAAFSALFELFSGKGQGSGYGIEQSYPTSPW